MNQKILVTAGASGIGATIAKAFAAAGARVHIADIDQAALDREVASHTAITGTVADITNAKAIDRLFDDVGHQLGGLDVLVNNAGIAGPAAPLSDYDRASWQAVLDVNLTGTFHVTQRAIPLLKKSGCASIIIMSALAGRFGYPNRSAYATTKWGLVGLTKTLAMELGPYGITCNAIQPGPVEGPRMRAVMEERAKLSNTPLQAQIDIALQNQSIKSFVDPEDVAALAIFLAGKHARMISGQTLPIDGDAKSTQ